MKKPAQREAKRNNKIVRLRKEKMTLKAIGEIYGMTPAAVKKIVDAAN